MTIKHIPCNEKWVVSWNLMNEGFFRKRSRTKFGRLIRTNLFTPSYERL